MPVFCIRHPAGESHLSNGLDPVAETAIRQLTEPSGRAAKKTPTKRSTLIISGVSKVTGLQGKEVGSGESPHGSLLPTKTCPSCQVPIAQDELALYLGYAASLDASIQDDAGPSEGPSSPPSDPPAMSPGPLDALSSPTSVQEADETTRSDISERPSVDDVESETGSTGALETRSLKDHKGGVILTAPPFLKTVLVYCGVMLGLGCCAQAFSSFRQGGCSLLQCVAFSLHWLLLLWSAGSRPAGFSS